MNSKKASRIHVFGFFFLCHFDLNFFGAQIGGVETSGIGFCEG
jgi:hypothetical protein